ncbi:hypothetical protein ACFQI7_35940 [Paenibacillus allorhizosphaerae]|uniref:Lipoprotein n=1 Tax=Paenibacillus allorhizosphaerae TaxID=2849866 RepID=A0ABM8VV74_9BACL|nr:hypothetical protein [Paenibacillus allorhizosphaerae]CAG7659104.1 hypothetical protein PAECIP111802_07373 [Paenibacillus allorhizosphaerae]
MRFFSFILLATFALMLAACKEQPNPSTTVLPKDTNINQNIAGSTTRQEEGGDARLYTNTSQPSNSPSSFFDESEWVGTWKWDQSTKNDISTIKIMNIKEGKLFFSLNAYHVTNPTSDEGHNGELADETAVLIGNEATYKNGKYDFELRMLIVDHHLIVMTKGKESPFGAFAEVDGRYSKVLENSQASNKTSDISKVQKSSDSIIGDMLKEQSFSVKFESLGDCEFVSTIEKKEDYKDQPHFYVNTSDTVSELKYELEWPAFLDSISAVSFRDVNGDGMKDIIVIVNFMTGAGQMGAIPFSKVLIFKQTESGFAEDKVIEKKARKGVPYRILSVQDVMIGLKTDLKDSVTNAWIRLQTGEYTTGSNDLTAPTLVIKESTGDTVLFSLDSGYSSIKESTERGKISEIVSGRATTSYEEMIYKEGDYELSFYLINNSDLYVSDNGKSHLGQNVYVKGIYSLKK